MVSDEFLEAVVTLRGADIEEGSLLTEAAQPARSDQGREDLLLHGEPSRGQRGNEVFRQKGNSGVDKARSGLSFVLLAKSMNDPAGINAPSRTD